MLIKINNAGAGDKIITCFTIPKVSFVDNFVNGKMNGSTTINLDCCIISQGSYTTSAKTIKVKHRPYFDIDIDHQYIPKNKKMLQFPYMYIGTGAFASEKKIYKYENFYDVYGNVVDNTADNANDLSFTLCSEFNPNPSLLVNPTLYKSQYEQSGNEPIVIQNYPSLAYFNDVFNTWLAENLEMTKLNVQQQTGDLMFGFGRDILSGVSAGISVGSSGGGASTAQASVGFLSSLLSPIQRGYDYDMQIRKTMANIKQQSLLPDNVNLGGSSTLLGYGLINKNIFNLYSITYEYAKRIDDYFSAYGYTINQMKVPNIKSRTNWNYIKTIGANIHADIPQRDLDIIKNMFNNGITFWHNPTTFLDYSQTNA